MPGLALALPGNCATAWPWSVGANTLLWIAKPLSAGGKQGGPISAGLSLGMRIGSKPLSDKELGAVVDESLEDGVCPWGSTAALLKHHRDHALINRGPLVSIFVDPLVCSNFAVRVLCACQTSDPT